MRSTDHAAPTVSSRARIVSGWIKLEKDLETDIRVHRIAKRLGVTDVTHGRYTGNAGVTVVLGALARLWMYADSHIREDDSLDMTPDEIDEWLGIPGFCRAMPEDWLLVRPDGCVELPQFQEHNSPEAKSRALTQRRVARHRKRKSVTACNAGALPDQTRLDQTNTHTDSARAIEAIERHYDFDAIKAAYPQFSGRTNWAIAEGYYRTLIDRRGVPHHELLEAVKRYAAYVAAGGVSSTRYVLTPVTFFSAGDEPWKQPWAPPTPLERKPALTWKPDEQSQEVAGA